MIKKDSRIRWADIFKGIVIFLMVFAHTPTMCTKYIYTFHMVAFFFISGFTQDFNKKNFANYVTGKFKSIMIPFLKYNIIFFALIYSLKLVNLFPIFYTEVYDFEKIKNFCRYLWTSDLAGATWFLIILFLGTISAKLLNDIAKEKFKKNIEEKKLIISFILFVCGFFLYNRSAVTIVFCIDLIPLAVFFIELGNYLKLRSDKISKKIKYIFGIGIILIDLYFLIINFKFVSLASRQFPNILIFLILSFAGILVIYIVSKLIEKLVKTKFKWVVNAIEYLGKNTLYILIFHFIGFRLMFVILYLFNVVDISQLSHLTPQYQNFGLCLLTTVFAIVFSLAMAQLIKLGEKKILRKKKC